MVKHDLLGNDLVNGHTRSHDATSGVRDLHHFQQPLNRTILTIAPMQTDKGLFSLGVTQLGGQIFTDIHRDGITVVCQQGLQDSATCFQGNIPFGRKATHQYGCPLIFQLIPIHHDLSHVLLPGLQRLQQIFTNLPDVACTESDDDISWLDELLQMVHRRFRTARINT